MSTPGVFFLPGPTEVAADVLEAQVATPLGHRTSEGRALVRAVERGMRPLLGTTAPVLVGTMSATGFMEAAIRGGVRRRLLALVNGAFSGRFAEIARGCGREVEVLEVPWGATVDPAAVAERLRSGRFDALTLTHSETSTGALNPVGEIAAVAAGHDDVVVLVDSVSSAGGTEVAMEEWGVDLVLTGAQKALALPPGVSFAAASERLLERAATLPGRGFYLDLVRFARGADGGDTPTTPALTLLAAAHRQLERIAAETLPRRFARHAAMAAACARAVDALAADGIAVRLLAPPGGRSPTVSCITLPPDRTAAEVVAGVQRRGFRIGAGYGPLGDSTIRIGHMGEHTVAGVERVMAAVADTLRSPPSGGVG